MYASSGRILGRIRERSSISLASQCLALFTRLYSLWTTNKRRQHLLSSVTLHADKRRTGQRVTSRGTKGPEKVQWIEKPTLLDCCKHTRKILCPDLLLLHTFRDFDDPLPLQVLKQPPCRLRYYNRTLNVDNLFTNNFWTVTDLTNKPLSRDKIS